MAINNISITDYIVFGLFLYFAYKGWRKGFFKTLLKPITLIAGIFMGIAYYHRTGNLAISFFISVLSPFILTFCASLILSLWNKAVDGSKPASSSSRLFGSLLSILWGGSYITILIAAIGMFPLKFGILDKIQKDVTSSKSYFLITKWVMDKTPYSSSKLTKVTEILQNPQKLEKFESTKEYKAVIADDDLRILLNDDETAEQIQNKDYAKLLSNPKFQTIFQNPELLKKIMDLNKVIIDSKLGDGEDSQKPESKPKVIEIPQK